MNLKAQHHVDDRVHRGPDPHVAAEVGADRVRPRAEDVPSDLECRFVQNADGSGPFGAKGAGEGSLIPVSPAIANALARLTGLRLRELPLTPERVWRALREHRASAAR